LILDEVTRDYVYSIKDEQLRKAKLIPWLEDEIDQDELCESDPSVQNEPDENYFNVKRKTLYLFFDKIRITYHVSPF
jgi:hypothetical protein